MGSKVLLADDSVTIQKVVGIIFANEDYQVTIVSNGDAALQKARETRPDVMLVDALMPGKNGYEVCQEIRRDPALQHVSLLLMTGAFDAVDEEKKRQSGADDFITKPFESQALLDVTARLIDLSRERAHNKPQPAPAAAPSLATQPAAPPPATAAVTPAAEAAAPSVDDIWGEDFSAGFEEEKPAPAADPFATVLSPAAAVAPAPVAATSDDDLWGVFDMDALDVEAPAAVVAPSAPPVTTAADDFFSFDDEAPVVTTPPPAPAMEEFVLDEMADSEQLVEEQPTASADVDAFGGFDLEPAAESVAPPVITRAPITSEEDFSTISFDEPETAAVPPQPLRVEPPVAPVAVVAPMPAEEDFSTISFDEPEAPAAPPQPLRAEPPVAPPVEPAAPAPTPQPAVVAPAAVAAAVTLDEEQLKMLLSKVSRDVIEKIVWEVVPDLAESIIREEIRKLKEGIAS